MARDRWPLIVVAVLGPAASAACGAGWSADDVDGAPPPPTVAVAPYGEATIAPAQVRGGTTLTITPAGVVDRICNDAATVRRLTAAGPTATWFAIAQPADGGRDWQLTVPDGPPLSIAACRAPAGAAPSSYVVPDGHGAGPFLLCLTDPADPAACATFTVTA